MARPQAYMTAVELLVELASLQTAFLTLDEAIKTTNRRVNALDNVVIPKLENTIAYIKARAPRRAAAASLPRPCLLAGRLSSAELCAACKRRLDTYQAPSGYSPSDWALEQPCASQGRPMSTQLYHHARSLALCRCTSLLNHPGLTRACRVAITRAVTAAHVLTPRWWRAVQRKQGLA